jgi:hypothetical protein
MSRGAMSNDRTLAQAEIARGLIDNTDRRPAR